jgi:hypothetical protein
MYIVCLLCSYGWLISLLHSHVKSPSPTFLKNNFFLKKIIINAIFQTIISISVICYFFLILDIKVQFHKLEVRARNWLGSAFIMRDNLEGMCKNDFNIVKYSSRSASCFICLHFLLLSVTTQQLPRSHSSFHCKMRGCHCVLPDDGSMSRNISKILPINLFYTGNVNEILIIVVLWRIIKEWNIIIIFYILSLINILCHPYTSICEI